MTNDDIVLLLMYPYFVSHILDKINQGILIINRTNDIAL